MPVDLPRTGPARLQSWMRSLRVQRLVLLGLTLALSFGSSACQSSPDKRVLQYLNREGFGTRYSGNPEEENYLTIGDSFTFQDEFGSIPVTNARVDLDGTIQLFPIGAVPVAGMTRTQVEAYLTQKLSPFYERVGIRMLSISNTNPKYFYLFGEVGGGVGGGGGFGGFGGGAVGGTSSARIPIREDLTIFDVLVQNAPNRVTANTGRIRLIRADPRDPLIMTFDMRDMVRYGDSTFNFQIRERDIIVVPPTMLAELGSFLSALITPFTQIFSSLTLGLLNLNRINQFGNQGNFNIF